MTWITGESHIIWLQEGLPSPADRRIAGFRGVPAAPHVERGELYACFENTFDRFLFTP